MRRGSFVLAAAGLAAFFTSCACRLSIPASVCVQQNADGPLPGGGPRLCLVSPATSRSPATLILYATSDGGWSGTSKALFRHLAERGDPLVGISSRNYLKDVKREPGFITPDGLAQDLASIILAAKHDLNLPAATPTILVGMSRGAGFMVVAAAQRALQPRPAGAIALALTRETDYVRHRLIWRRPSARRDVPRSRRRARLGRFNHAAKRLGARRAAQEGRQCRSGFTSSVTSF